jgi:acetyl esterase/lipase
MVGSRRIIVLHQILANKKGPTSMFRIQWLIVLAFVITGLAGVRADNPKSTQQPLWPDGVPGATSQDEGDVPQLFLTLVESDQPTAAIVILPGGGYGGHAIDHEGHQFAQWFASLGVSSAICNYRLRGKGNSGKGYGHPYPMIDAQRAIQTLRAKADDWNIDPSRVGVVGFSAGGHLCSTVSTHFAEIDKSSSDPIASVSSRPDFAILAYPVIGFDKPYTHRGSQRNLLGENPDPKLVKLLSNEEQVSKETPPTFLFHTVEDRGVPVENSIEYFKACRKHGVSVEMHLFPKGRHGLGLAKSVPGASQWPSLCEQWLRGLGVVTKE